MVSHVGVRNALGIPKWGRVAGYEWSVDSGHDETTGGAVSRRKGREVGKILAIDLAVLHGTVDFLTTIFEGTNDHQ